MNEQDFLIKLEKQGKLKLEEQSKEISDSYIQKANNCLSSAKLLSSNNLYENSIINSYYTMYNSLLSLLYKIGIKSENHTASIILLKELFQEEQLHTIISKAKEERIDKQYYVESKENSLKSESAQELVKQAEDFLLEIKLITGSLNNEQIDNFRKKFKELFGDT